MSKNRVEEKSCKTTGIRDWFGECEDSTWLRLSSLLFAYFWYSHWSPGSSCRWSINTWCRKWGTRHEERWRKCRVADDMDQVSSCGHCHSVELRISRKVLVQKWMVSQDNFRFDDRQPASGYPTTGRIYLRKPSKYAIINVWKISCHKFSSIPNLSRRGSLRCC